MLVHLDYSHGCYWLYKTNLKELVAGPFDSIEEAREAAKSAGHKVNAEGVNCWWGKSIVLHDAIKRKYGHE